MRINILFILVILISCKKEKVETPENGLYSEWENYFDIEDPETGHFINSMVLNKSNEVIFSAFIRRNHYTVDSTWIFEFEEGNIRSIDTAAYFEDYDFLVWEQGEAKKEIWLNRKLMFIHDENENTCCKWHVTDLDNKRESARSQVDYHGNIWIASDKNYTANDGLLMFDGTDWSVFFEGTDFWAVCFDKSGNLYANTVSNLEEPGVVMKYDYNKWDTVMVSSGNAKWVSCMYSDHQNNLWLGVLSRYAVAPESGDGLFKLKNGTITNYNIYNSKIPSNSVIDITVDHENNKWIATYSGGLVKFSPDGKWKIFNPQNTPMTNSSIEHVMVDGNNNVWIADFYGLARFRE